MSDEQTQTFGPESDPADFTVDQVNAYLAGLDGDDAEVQRVLAAEKDGKDRKGITEAIEGAPQGDEKPQVTTEAKTFSEAAEDAVESRHEAYAQGYFGTVPSRDGDNPVDLTLAGVTKSDKDS